VAAKGFLQSKVSAAELKHHRGCLSISLRLQSMLLKLCSLQKYCLIQETKTLSDAVFM